MLHASYSSRVGYARLAWKTEVRIRFGTCGENFKIDCRGLWNRISLGRHIPLPRLLLRKGRAWYGDETDLLMHLVLFCFLILLSLVPFFALILGLRGLQWYDGSK